MAASPTDAANAAIDRLRTLREQARQRREQVKQAVKDVRERNHEESMQAMLRVRSARRQGTPVWPAAHQDDRTMHLYEDDEPESPAQRPTTAPRRPAHVDDDDWSNETWLH